MLNVPDIDVLKFRGHIDVLKFRGHIVSQLTL